MDLGTKQVYFLRVFLHENVRVGFSRSCSKSKFVLERKRPEFRTPRNFSQSVFERSFLFPADHCNGPSNSLSNSIWRIYSGTCSNGVFYAVIK